MPMKRAKPLFLFWLLAIGVIVYMTLTYESESADLYGIAETKEIVVNWEHAVDIKMIVVVEGQEILPTHCRLGGWSIERDN